jgi:DNA-binding IclR family transcriptional regulator
LKCTLEENILLNSIKNNPSATQKEIAEAIGKSERTVKRLTVSLQEKGLLIRHNGKHYGWWEVLLPMLNT